MTIIYYHIMKEQSKVFGVFLLLFLFLLAAPADAKRLRTIPKVVLNPNQALSSIGSWNTSMGGFISPEKQPGLKKSTTDQSQWSALLRLKRPQKVSQYLGKTLYFFTETKGDPIARCAPNFFVNKNGKHYDIWWNISKSDEQNISRQYISFPSNSSGLISGEILIPKFEDAYFYALEDGAEKAFRVTEQSKVSLVDIRNSMMTDWQHDIPGEYYLSENNRFPGYAGSVVFTRFYFGTKETQPIFDRERDKWLSQLSSAEKKAVADVFAISIRFADKQQRENEYVMDNGTALEIKSYYDANRSLLNTDPFFKTKNYLPWGLIVRNFRVANKEPLSKCTLSEGKIIIENKHNAADWTVLKIGENSDPVQLKALVGVARMSAVMDAQGIKHGYFDWQTVILDIVQLDAKGQEIGENDDVRLPILPNSKIANYTGVFENEFIISDKTRKLEVYLKIAGVPAIDRDKLGITLDKLVVEKIHLAKASTNFDMKNVFETLPEQPVVNQTISGRPTLVFISSGKGLIIGDRSLSLKKNNGWLQIEFNVLDSQSFSGVYSNIFDVSELHELEMAAEMQGQLTTHGAPPNWAASTIEIQYYDRDGKQVSPADHGAEKYQNLQYNPAQPAQLLKGFFVVPHERGAVFAQIKCHFIRVFEPKTNRFDDQNYYTGKASVSNIIVRPARSFLNAKNAAPENGTFYKHQNGRSLSWGVDGVNVEEDLKAQTRRLVFENIDKTWGSLKLNLEVPTSAMVLKGVFNLDIQKIATGLEEWKGFGLFLEADVEDEFGNRFHYGGVPAFKREGDRLVRFDRIPIKQKEKVEFYIPLFHENLKIHSLTWQLALAGTGKVILNPLESGANGSLISLQFLESNDIPPNPAFWTQYSLSETDASGFTFQKHFELSIDNQTQGYETAEGASSHLAGYLQKDIDISEQLKQLPVGSTINLNGANIKATPSYARVSREYNVPVGATKLCLSFQLSSKDLAAKFNFKPLLIDGSSNVLELDYFLKTPQGVWVKTLAKDDVFNLIPGDYEVLIPVKAENFKAEKVRLIFGDNQGQISYRNLDIAFLNNINESEILGLDTSLKGSVKNSIFAQKAVSALNINTVLNPDRGALDSKEFAALSTANVLQGLLNIANYAQLTERDRQIRNSIKTGKIKFTKGKWVDGKGRPFQQVGVTIVGETFNKWYELRRAEFEKMRYADKRLPYWAVPLSQEEQHQVLIAADSNEFTKKFLLSQALIWQESGINTIRVHQLFANWAGLDKEEIDLTISLLKLLQKEKGFLISFDLLPNPDFTGQFFSGRFAGNSLAQDLSNTNLFKTALVLPEVNKAVVQPALKEIFKAFNKQGFWPNSLSYCNETGLMHGFWLVDKANPQAHPTISREYHYYYQNFLAESAKLPALNAKIDSLYALMQNQIQAMQILPLLDDLRASTKMLQQKQRIKDNASYIYYNLLWSGTLQKYPAFAIELEAYKESLSPLVKTPATLQYYLQELAIMQSVEQKLALLELAVQRQAKKNAKDLQDKLLDPAFTTELSLLQKAVFLTEMPAGYKIPAYITFSYLDTFDFLSTAQQKQAFFTSFLLPISFAKDINALIQLEASGKSYNIGLNNDFTKDAFALLANSYLAVNDPLTEQRFNKYTHHPIGGHSMLLNPGQGTVFDDDSNIDMNLQLFTPLTGAGLPAQLSETNYTYAGDDHAGQGNWSVMDYLKVIARGNSLLSFHLGLNHIDQPIINDYFSIGNKPFKVSALSLVGVVALAKQINPDFIRPTDFSYNRFQRAISLQGYKISGLAGSFDPYNIVSNNDSRLAFTYTGQRESVDMAIFAVRLGKDILVDFYGIERNSEQQNQPANPNLIKAYGSAPIIYQEPYGGLAIKLDDNVTEVVIYGFTPTRQKIKIPLRAYSVEDGILLLDTTKISGGVVSYKIEQK